MTPRQDAALFVIGTSIIFPPVALLWLFLLACYVSLAIVLGVAVAVAVVLDGDNDYYQPTPF